MVRLDSAYEWQGQTLSALGGALFSEVRSKGAVWHQLVQG